MIDVRSKAEARNVIIRKTIEPTSLEIGLTDPFQDRLHLPNMTRDDAVKPRLVRPREPKLRRRQVMFPLYDV
jgi:hypothetical protein